MEIFVILFSVVKVWLVVGILMVVVVLFEVRVVVWECVVVVLMVLLWWCRGSCVKVLGLVGCVGLWMFVLVFFGLSMFRLWFCWVL